MDKETVRHLQEELRHRNHADLEKLTHRPWSGSCFSDTWNALTAMLKNNKGYHIWNVNAADWLLCNGIEVVYWPRELYYTVHENEFTKEPPRKDALYINRYGRIVSDDVVKEWA